MRYYLFNKERETMVDVGPDMHQAILKAKYGLPGDEIHEAREPGAGLVCIWPKQERPKLKRGAPRKAKEDRLYKVQATVPYAVAEWLTAKGNMSLEVRKVLIEAYQQDKTEHKTGYSVLD